MLYPMARVGTLNVLKKYLKPIIFTPDLLNTVRAPTLSVERYKRTLRVLLLKNCGKFWQEHGTMLPHSLGRRI